MKIFSLIILLSIVGCKTDNTQNGNTVIKIDNDQPLKFSCIELGPSKFNIHRCENTEVICYRIYKGGLQCKFKRTLEN